uniref:KASH domain-containing protein n=1 Tax=Scylla olivacea TaxID=85551 RepID=A0A0P4WID6_SCYOL
MEDEHQEAKRARTIRFEYNRDVESVQAWIQAAEAKVQDKSVEPHKLKEFLQEIHCEIGSVTDQLERLTRHGHMICQRTSNQGERELVANTITSLTEQLQQVKNWLEDKKAQVGDSLESWQLFIQLYNSLRSWVERQRNFLSEPLKFATLPEARGKLQEYTAAVKDCKWANKQAAEMTAELAKIGQCSDVGPLTDKQAEMEQEKADVESNLKEVMALLQEMAEEWEQCERKSKDVAGWIEKTRQSLDNPQNKKRSLRDQLANREKVLADVSIQKTKLVMAMEKLQVHFRDRMCAEAQVSHENEKLQRRLDELQVAVKEDCRTLEACVHQMDAYQQVSVFHNVSWATTYSNW